MPAVPYLVDPVAVGAVIGALALILFAAAWHKLSEHDVFAGALEAYQLLPTALVPLAARVLPVVEVLLGIAILVPITRAQALAGTAMLMLVYAAAMSLNLGRGRDQIDCGCGGESHSLSWALVARNVVLAGAALAVAGPTVDRGFEWLDGVTLIVSVLAFYVLYLMADELLRQASRLRQLSQAHVHEEAEVK
ncbi:MAG: hypothetical protein IT532_02895 [Burkholderiales bacterium]|nr:hypothetical protein [Burkholderiales bacterium]